MIMVYYDRTQIIASNGGSSQSLFFYYIRIIIVINGVIDVVTECIFDLVKDILVEAS